VTVLYGERGIANLLLLSQVIRSMQLSFAVIPLILFTNDQHKMGLFVNSRGTKIIAWVVAAIILLLNLYLLYDAIK